MNAKKFMAGLLSGILTATSIFTVPLTGFAEPVELFRDGFEDGDTCGWASHGGAATVSISTEQAYAGEASFYITDRANNWQGGECSKVGYLYAGETYTISIAFYYDDESGNASQNFELGYKYTESGSTSYGSVGSVTANKGEWAVMTATTTFPSDITGITLYTQCSDVDLPYYIDECYATGEAYSGETQDGFFYDFEDGKVADWVARDCDIAISSQYGHDSSYSLYTSGRTDLWNSPALDCNLYCQIGGYYEFSCWAMYIGDSWTETAGFQIYLMYNKDGTTNYQNLADEKTTPGEWVKISSRFTIPEGASNLMFYVQPTWSSNPSDQDLTIDFYIDDVSCVHLPDPTIQSDLDSLCEAYSDYFKIGCASTASELIVGATKDLILKHYNSLTFGNELKPSMVLDQAATLALGSETEVAISLEAAEPLLEFAAENQIPVRGHCLVWHSQTPSWFFKEGYNEANDWVSRDVMLARMENYIKTLMETLATQWPDVEFYCWDVVNEAFAESGELRTPGDVSEDSNYSMWMQTIGEDFIDYAFTYARKYAPEGCKLFYNDYNEYASAKRAGILEKVADLASKGLIDGVGMQSHIKLGDPTIAAYEETIRLYSALGLEVQITELDVNTKDNSNAGQLELAERYRQVMECIKTCKDDGCNITAVVFWGITDATSWIGGYPLLFDEDYQAKPSFYAVLDTDAEIQRIRNKNAIACDELTVSSVEKAMNVQASTAIGDVGSFKAAWCDDSLIIWVTSEEDGSVLLYFNDSSTVYQISAGETLELGVTIPEGTTFPFDIVINDTAWNSLTAVTEETCGTITLAEFPPYADAVYGTPVIDGAMDEIWSTAPAIDINKFQMGNSSYNAYGTARALWDSDNLYILVEVTDSNGLYQSSSNHYEQDTVEIFFDENNHKTSAYESDDIQCRIGFDGSKTVSDNHSVDDFISSAMVEDATGVYRYYVEIAIPQSLGSYTTGQVVGFDVQINDDDGSGARSGISNWTGDTTGLGYTNTENFGVLMLTGEPDVTRMAGDANIDGEVKMNDIILLTKFMNDSVTLVSQGKINADVDGSDAVTASDISMILTYLSNQISYKELESYANQ